MEAIKLIGLFLAALLGTTEAADAPQGYKHTLRLTVVTAGPKDLQPVLAALGGIAVSSLDTPTFEVTDGSMLPQPGDYEVHLTIAIVPLKDELGPEPAFEVGVSWTIQGWCSKGEMHMLKRSPLLQTAGTASTVLPHTGRIIKDGARGIHDGILAIDQRFIESIESESVTARKEKHGTTSRDHQPV
jgi:hypothetical protein